MRTQERSPGRWWQRHGAVLVVAIVLTVLNALKPPTSDDPAYLRQAAWWAAHPLDPLGGEVLWYQTLVPTRVAASAPVGIAWLALGERVVGEANLALKLWLFPIAWLLAWAIDQLLRRAAPRLATPLLVLTVLSPTVLPGFDFLLDVPALALATAALAVFSRAIENGAWRGLLAAGLLAGLALQTKYTAAPVLVVLVLWGLLAGRWRAGALAAGVALAVFVVIELSLAGGAGGSPLGAYLASRSARDPQGHVPLLTAKRLMLIAGGVAPALVPLALTALAVPRRIVHLALFAVMGGFVLLAFAPAPLAGFLDGVTGGRVVSLDNVAIQWMGPVLAILAALVVGRTGWSAAGRADVLPRVCIGWLGVEAALAPFVSASASARRVLGAVLALTLVIARRVSDAVEREPERRRDVIAIAVCGVALGIGFWLADRDAALADARALAQVRERTAGATVAYVGDHWGAFQDAARRAGWVMVTVERAPLARGDWLAVPFGVEMRDVTLEADRVVLVDSVPLPHRMPLTTKRSYFDGRQALRRPDSRWVGAYLYRVTADGLVLRRSGRDGRAP